MHTQKYYCNTLTQYVYINIQVNQNATCGLSKKYPNVSYNILNNTNASTNTINNIMVRINLFLVLV